MAAGGVAACIGIGLIVNQVHNSARKEDNILEANAGKLIDTEKETVTEQVKAQTETLEIVKTEDVTETMKESAEDSLKKGEWGELTQWISLRSQTTYGGKVIGRYKKGTKVKILEKNDGWYKVYILGELGYVPVNTVISSVQEEKKETEKVTEAVEETAEELYKLGYTYTYGGAKDYQKALEYYEHAATLGSSAAMNGLGIMYMRGEGVEQDIEKAREYFEQAVELGNPAAKYNLQALDAMEEEPETEETTEDKEESADAYYINISGAHYKGFPIGVNRLINIDSNIDQLTVEYDNDVMDVSWSGSSLNIKINSYDGKWHRIDIYNEDKDASTYFYVTGYR